MKITLQPDSVSALRPSLNYVIENVDPAAVTQVTVYNAAGNILGIKRFRNAESYNVNVAPIVGPYLDASPLYCENCALLEVSSRYQNIHITAEQIVKDDSGEDNVVDGPLVSESCSVYEAEKMIHYQQDLIHEISWDEFDEIPLYTDKVGLRVRVHFAWSGGSDSVVVTNDMPGIIQGAGLFDGGGKGILFLSMRHLAGVLEDTSKYTSMKVEISGQDPISSANEVITARTYSLVTRYENSVRICWLDKHGDICYYTFGKEIYKKLTTEKSKVRTGGEYLLISSQETCDITAATDYESHTMIEWLWGVICAEKVWKVAEGPEFHKIEVTTTGSSVVPEELNYMEITYRDMEA